MNWANGVALASRAVMCAVFAVSVFSKVRSRAAWQAYARWLAAMGIRPLRRPGSAGWLTGAESAVTVAVIIPATATVGLAAGVLLSLALTAGLAAAVRAGARQPCYCFGPSLDPLGWLDVARNGVLAVLAVAGAVAAMAMPMAFGGAPAGADAAAAVVTGLALALLIIFFRDLASLIRPVAFAGGRPVLRPGPGMERR
ncbi:MAG: MauE/DoxX family redox-associated membrane protein [Streptosporangiaceae bacterium]